MRKIKVLQVCGGLSPEGIGVFLLNMMENIDTERFDITFALATKYPQVYENRIVAAGGKIIRTYEIGDGLKGKIKHFVNLTKIIKENGPFDAVHSHMDFFNGINLLGALIGGARKRISHAHVAGKPKISFAERMYYMTMRTMITCFSTHKVGCSTVANSNINGKGQVIYNGIDLLKFTTPKYFPHDVAFDRTKKNLITVGRMDYPKNPFFLLKIIKHLSSLEKNFHFYWVGSGLLENEIRQLSKDMQIESNIIFLKNRTGVAKLMRQMDMFILPSIYEGLPIVLVEAQASNLPCIVSTAVTKEVDLGLCKYLDLNSGEKHWANEIYAFLHQSKKNVTIDKERSQRFDVSYMVETLHKLYALN